MFFRHRLSERAFTPNMLSLSLTSLCTVSTDANSARGKVTNKLRSGNRVMRFRFLPRRPLTLPSAYALWSKAQEM